MRTIVYFIVLSILFFSCQKELSFQNDSPNSNTEAVFSFSGAPAACSVATPSGYYASGTVLTSANTVTIQVNVITTGTYNISTNTVNGYKFSAAGAFATTGTQTVALTGAGTPVASQTDNFTPVAGNSIPGCSFNIIVSTPSPAVYTLSGAPGACTMATINGDYILNTSLASTNTVAVQVNVTTVGTFTLSTNTVGGMVFSKSGAFSSTGIQTVILEGSGTPTTSGSSVFTVGAGGCTFTIPVTGPAVYMFSGAPGACTIAIVNGTYSLGAALSTSNTVTVRVNVLAVGVYTISTTAGGMTFSKSGIFTTSGIQTIILVGSGTPATGGANTFTVGSGGCTFIIPVS
jgi:hypothetical protein